MRKGTRLGAADFEKNVRESAVRFAFIPDPPVRIIKPAVHVPTLTKKGKELPPSLEAISSEDFFLTNSRFPVPLHWDSHQSGGSRSRRTEGQFRWHS